MNTETIEVDPEFASELLASSGGNRPLSSGLIRRLVKAINDGEWLLTHQGIAIDTGGRLLDGHHRLTAVVSSGRTVPMRITYDADPETFAVIDDGKRRSAADVLGYMGEKNSQSLAASVRLLYLYEHGRPTGGESALMTSTQIVDELESHPGLRETIPNAYALRRACGMVLSAGMVGIYLTTRSNPHIDQSEWFEGVASGLGLLATGDPRLAFRDTMFRLRLGSTTRRRQDSENQLVWYIKAWNAWALGKPVHALRHGKNEARPMPVEVPPSGIPLHLS